MHNFLQLLFLLLFFSACNRDSSADGVWVITVSGSLPEPVSNQAVSEGFVGEVPFLYSFGGIDSTKLFSGIHLRSYKLNVLTGEAERIQNLPDTLGKIASAASRINDTIYIIGGYHVFEDGSEKSSDRVHRYLISENRFMEDGAPIPIPIDDQVQMIYKNRYIYVITGWSDKENIPAVQIYDAEEDRWIQGTAVPDNHDFKSFGASGSLIGNTIYYLGGASMGKNFPIQAVLRKGRIHPNNPAQIEWTEEKLKEDYVGYRMASFERKGKLYWVGGSNNTYNYNGIAYDGSGGVEPNGRLLIYDELGFQQEFFKKIPMDLRGIANIDDSVKYVVGGITGEQKTSQEIIKLEWID